MNSSIKVFNFRTDWHLVKPHLNHPKLQAVLKRGMEDYFATRAAEGVEAGLDPKHWQVEYDPERGPWSYCSSDYWVLHADGLAEQAIERGEFTWEGTEGEDPTEEEMDRYNNFACQFDPKPGTFEWYQLWGACHWLAPCLKELGKLVFPSGSWKIMTGEAHSLAYATDQVGNIRMIFDILNFETMSAMQLIEFASRKQTEAPESTPLPNPVEGLFTCH